MKQLQLRPARPEDAPQVVDWLNRNPLNRLDPEILNYPTLSTLCSYNSEPVCYLPMHKVLMLESIANNPNVSTLETAQALRDLVKAAGLIGSAQGIREIYFVGGEGGLGEMAEAHNFEKVKGEVFRMRLK